MPTVNSIELSTGDAILSPDVENIIPIDIVLYGSDLSQVDDLSLDGGEDVEWVVTGVSSSPNTVNVSAFVFGSEGFGELKIYFHDDVIFAADVGYVFPLID